MTFDAYLTNDTFDDIEDEIARAIEKHGVDQTPLNPSMAMHEKFIILVEEVGEVARAMTYDEGGSAAKLYEELIQVATMSAAMAQSLRGLL